MGSREFIQLFDEIIERKYKNSRTSGDIVLIERGRSKATILKNGICLVFQFDVQNEEANNLFPFFNREKEGLCKMNDYLILTHDDKNNINILLVELKSGRLGEGLEQLRAGHIFLEFVLRTIIRIGKNLNISLNDIKIRGVIFSDKTHKVGTKGTALKGFISDPLSDLKYKIVKYKEYELNYFFSQK